MSKETHKYLFSIRARTINGATEVASNVIASGYEHAVLEFFDMVTQPISIIAVEQICELSYAGEQKIIGQFREWKEAHMNALKNMPVENDKVN